MGNLAFQDPDIQCHRWLCSVMIHKVARKVRTSHTIPVISSIDHAKMYFDDKKPVFP